MSSPRRPSGRELAQVYARTKTIAVVGASASEDKAAHAIPAYLQSQGYRIIPVNPHGGEIFGERVYSSLHEVDVPIDVVDVFRPPAESSDVAREALSVNAPILWFQPGTETDEAISLAADAGLTVVSGWCMGAMHAKLGLGPGPAA